SDEVMSGFARTGKWFGVENHGVVPDIMALAKGITAGYLPFGALMVSDAIAKKFDNEPLMLGLTYSGHPVACAAALEVINIYEEDNLIHRTAAMGNYMEERIEEMKTIHPSIGDFRNKGLLGCIELVRNRKTKEPMASFNAKPTELVIMNQVKAKIAELGMYTFSKWSFIFIAPPLCISKEQIDEGLSILSEALKIADAVCES
ncbi:MAG: aminotransferase class III-fold pyridoxal phosphate-dependent enzyme, partial [Flavobacteriaceae bacterium]